MTAAYTALTTLSQLLGQRQRDNQRVTFSITEDWQQGRTMFGGVLSALAAQAMRDVCGADWPLRALQTNFVGPVTAGVVHIDVSLLRQGKNIRQVKAAILQADATGEEQICGVLLGVFGAGRASALPALSPQAAPLNVSPEKAFEWPFIPGLTPAFTQHVEFRHADGGTPYTGTDSWHSRIYVRMRQADDVDAELHAIMLTDSGPTPALAQLKSFSPASSVSWALELRPVAEDDKQGLWLMDKEALATGEGYVNEKTTLWTPSGKLAAYGYQVVAVYA